MNITLMQLIGKEQPIFKRVKCRQCGAVYEYLGDNKNKEKPYMASCRAHVTFDLIFGFGVLRLENRKN